jgi:thiol:disulfide interchange protein DsbA
MHSVRVLLLLSAALALAACSKHQDQPAAAAPAAQSARPATQSARPAAAAAVASAPGATAAQTSKLNKDGSETVEDAAGDSGAHNVLLAAVAATVAATTPAASAQVPAALSMWQEGVNYTRLVPAQPTDVPAGQVEVLEFFWYACPHCFALEPAVETWKKSKPSYITFVPVPVTWDEGRRALGRLFYTLESLGKLDQLHGDVFKEIQVNGNPLVAPDPSNDAQTERLQTAFAVKEGISDSAFKAAYHSMGVEARLQRADELVQRYRIDGVPTFVINGKYIADVRSAGGPDRLLSLISELAAREHKR